MSGPKTVKTDASVEDYLNTVENERKRGDSFAILELMKEVTGEEPVMWGPSIVGFGSYHYVYASGREGDWPVTGFAPRKQNLTLYITDGFKEYGTLLAKLGKHKIGKSCLYINKLEDVDIPTLKKLVKQSIKHVAELYPSADG